jgi:hypothetical protein
LVIQHQISLPIFYLPPLSLSLLSLLILSLHPLSVLILMLSLLILPLLILILSLLILTLIHLQQYVHSPLNVLHFIAPLFRQSFFSIIPTNYNQQWLWFLFWFVDHFLVFLNINFFFKYLPFPFGILSSCYFCNCYFSAICLFIRATFSYTVNG